MMSSLSWIVFDETERQRARRIMALFEEKETRDELGLGPVRDSVADHLFPGTSTIQTRLRYMLFVPWIYTMVEEMDASPERLRQAARAHEIRLIDALHSGGEEEGVIGRDARERLRRLPSSIYWNGLRIWGIRLFIGSQETYFDSLPSLLRNRCRSHSAEDDMAVGGIGQAAWNPDLPCRPRDLLTRTDFRLTGQEAGFLIDRLVNAQPDSLLTRLAKDGRYANCDYVWQHPDLAAFPPETRRLVEHAEKFSAAMHGAALLYNLMLAERRENEDWIERYRVQFDEWKSDEFDAAVISCWSLDDFWQCSKHENHRVRSPTRRFVHRWCELVVEKAGDVADLESARILVRERETSLKGTQSRFVNRTVLDRWGGRSGTGRLRFRWRKPAAISETLSTPADLPLHPDVRALYGTSLRPPAGTLFDAGVATSFSLDFETALAVPVALALFASEDRDELLKSPLALLEGLERTAERLAVFCEAGRIQAQPRPQSRLCTLLERLIIEVSAPHEEGSFHPKLWVLRYRPLESGEPVRMRLLDSFAKPYPRPLLGSFSLP